MPSPSLAIAWRSEQPVDQLFVSIRRVVPHEAADVPEAGRQPSQIIGCAADEGSLIRFRGRRETFGFEAAQNETIDVITDPLLVLRCRQIRQCGLLQGPQG